MPIQDLAGNLFISASSPMIGFVDAQLTQTRALTLRMYRFLIEGIREADQVDGDRFVERFLEGSQGVWNGIDRSIRSLPDMWSITKCDDRFLPYLKWIVGWTSELDYITDELDAVTLRRLISTSVPFWKVRGTEEALQEILALTTAARTRVLDWFDLRYIADETSVGEVHLGFDSWMIELPGPPDYPEKQINVRIVDDGTLNRRLVRNLCKLTRPSGERITISYLGFLDLFEVDDDASQWTQSNGGASPVVTDGSMFVGPTDNVFANTTGSDSWTNYVVSVTLKSAAMVFQVHRQSDQDGYIVLYSESVVAIYVLVAGVPTELGVALTYAPDYPDSIPPLGVDLWFTIDPGDEEAASGFHTLRTQVTQEGSNTRISVSLNGNFLLSVVDGTYVQGSFAFLGAYTPDTTEIREVEMFFLPLEEDFIDIAS
jgi:phage tail-like protein